MGSKHYRNRKISYPLLRLFDIVRHRDIIKLRSNKSRSMNNIFTEIKMKETNGFSGLVRQKRKWVEAVEDIIGVIVIVALTMIGLILIIK